MTRDRAFFLLLNIGHFLDHLFTLVFATVAALVLYREWGVSYDALLLYASPGFFAFGLFALPSGWLADRWSRDGMMVVFFIGIGMSAIVTSQAQSPMQIGIGLFVLGMFATFPSGSLRMDPGKIGTVYHVAKKQGAMLTVRVIWTTAGPDLRGITHDFVESDLIPFDPDRFA